VSNYWTQYTVLCSDGYWEYVYDDKWSAEQELARVNQAIIDHKMDVTAKIVEREVEAGEWSE
jgi:hypothetical protein